MATKMDEKRVKNDGEIRNDGIYPPQRRTQKFFTVQLGLFELEHPAFLWLGDPKCEPTN